MLTIDLYGSEPDGWEGKPDFVLPTTTEEQENWSACIPELPSLGRERGRHFLEDYRTAMDGFDKANARADAYWYGAFGSRNTQNSSFYQGLEQLWRLDRHLRTALSSNTPFGLVVPSRHMVRPVSELAARHGVAVRHCGGFAGHRPLDALRRPWGAIRYLFILCDYGRMHGDYGPAETDVVFATVSADHLLRPDREERDFIFGNLPSDAEKSGVRVLVMTQLTGEIQPAAGRARGLPSPPVRTFIDLARPRNVVAAILRAGAWRLSPGPMQSNLGISVAALVKHDVQASRWRDLPTAFLLRGVLARLLDRNPNAVIAHPFENNGWEYACQVAARERKTETVAFQHNALLPLSEKTHANAQRERPTRIVTTGSASKTALCRDFGYRESDIEAGYAMRQSGAYTHARKSERPRAIDRILVLLQGTAASIQLLNILADAFAEDDSYTVTLRPHPAVPLDRQLSTSKLKKLRSPFRKSDLDDLYADIASHDAAVSVGSTAGWEAVALGVPTVHVDLGAPASGNPMYAEPALCRTVETGAELRRALKEFSEMSSEDFEAESGRARQYFEAYFARKTDDAFGRVFATLKRKAAA